MFRRGKYAMYRGKEFRLIKTADGELFLLSKDPNDVQNGFLPDDDHTELFLKKISKNDMESAYYVDSFAQYDKYTFGIISEERDSYLLGISNARIAQELGMENVSQGEWHLRVKKDEIKVVETVEPLWGFQLPTTYE